MQMSFQRAEWAQQRRSVPRPFSFPWGKGEIVEEVSVRGKHHEPCIQLLQFTDGLEIVRFCSYTLSGRFERNSWLAGKEDIEALSAELKKTARLRAFLERLVVSKTVGA